MAHPIEDDDVDDSQFRYTPTVAPATPAEYLSMSSSIQIQDVISSSSSSLSLQSSVSISSSSSSPVTSDVSDVNDKAAQEYSINDLILSSSLIERDAEALVSSIVILSENTAETAVNKAPMHTVKIINQETPVSDEKGQPGGIEDSPDSEIGKKR